MRERRGCVGGANHASFKPGSPRRRALIGARRDEGGADATSATAGVYVGTSAFGVVMRCETGIETGLLTMPARDMRNAMFRADW